jgi:hypothetical protein
MAQVPFQALYNGPFVGYTSPTGMSSPITGSPYLGGSLHEGDYVDLEAREAAIWNVAYGNKLYPGRYRLTKVSPNATNTNFGFGYPVGYGLGTFVANAIVAAGGSAYVITATGQTTGTVAISSSAAGGTAATANITLSAGVITSAQITYAGANMTSVPTFTLSSVLSTGSGGSLVAEQYSNPNFISSFDSTSANLADVRGIALTTLTAAQITGGIWIVIQELGDAPVYVTTASGSPASGNIATAATAAAVTTNTNTGTTTPQYALGYIGNTIDTPAATSLCRVRLRLPVVQG